MRLIRRILALAAGAAAALAPFAAQAQITILPPCAKSGDCAVSDILAVAVNVAEFLLSIMGAVALVMFIIGGFWWVFSGGKDEWVKKGRDTVRNATIGIILILMSGVIVRFVNQALTGGASPINLVGDSCASGKGLYVLIPAGVDKNDEKKIIPEEVKCITKSEAKKGEPCLPLNDAYKDRSRSEVFNCVSINTPGLKGCVRGLCKGGADSACCTTGVASGLIGDTDKGEVGAPEKK